MGRWQRGDTLVEVAVAMAILSLVLASSVVLGTTSIKVGRSAKERSQAAEFAQSQAEALRSYRDAVPWNTFFNNAAIKSGGNFVMVNNSGNWVPSAGQITNPPIDGTNSLFTIHMTATEPYNSEVDYDVQVTWPSNSGGPQNVVEFNSILTNPLATSSDAVAAQAIGSTIQAESFTAPGGCYAPIADGSASNGQALIFCSSNSYPVSYTANLPRFSSITVSARQQFDPGATDGLAGPTMVVEMDGCVIYQGTVSSTSYTVTPASIVPSPCNSNAGLHTFHIEMASGTDSCSACQNPQPNPNGDRNLFVDYITLNP